MSTTRTLFGHPIRVATTAAFYPDRLTLDQFEAWANGGAKGYADNMRQYPGGWSSESHYIEEWVETWLAWSEVETE